MNIRVLSAGIVVIVALGIIGAVFYFPLSTEPVRIVKLADAPESVQLAPQVHLKQRVHLSEGLYSSIAVFSNDQALGARKLKVTITDHRGNFITKSTGDITTYRPSANVLRIEVPVTWFTVSRDAFYIMDIWFDNGQSLSLRSLSRDTNLPAVHKLSLDGTSVNQILSLSIMKRISTVFGIRQGVMIGVAFMIAVSLLQLLKSIKHKMIAAMFLILFFAPLAVLGYWYSTGDLGIADWDYYIALHDSYRKAILTHYTFPFWNPYPCGGTAGLADPEFPLFTPTFLLEFIFGVSNGVRLAIMLSVATGGIGMLFLARRLGRSVEAGLVAALAVAFGSVNLLEITEGHVNVFAAIWIPWIFWSWLGVYRGKTKPIVCGIFLAMTFLAGGIYLLMYTALAFLGLLFLAPNFRASLTTTLKAGLWALGLSAFKLIPVLFWLDQFPDDAYTASAYTLPWITDILFGRYLHGTYIILNQGSGWHEYGAYIGYGVFALALVGAALFVKNKIVRSLCIASIVALLVSTLGPQLQPIFDYLWFFPRSNISRFILFAVIPIALLASYGVDRIAKMLPQKLKQIGISLIIGFIAIDIISLTYQVSEQAFILPHVVPNISPAPSPIAFTPDRFDSAGQGSRTTRSVDAYFAGYGTMVYCSVLGPKPAVRTIYDEESNDAVIALDKAAQVDLVSWNYNKISVHVETPVATKIVLNTNYAEGWTVNGKKAIIVDNRVATEVGVGTQDIVFTYKAPGFPLGIGITIFTIAYLSMKRFKRMVRLSRDPYERS